VVKYEAVAVSYIHLKRGSYDHIALFIEMHRGAKIKGKGLSSCKIYI
jgi:hypothetical protein